ncbi:hypothetical protein M422DRAFT_68132 [Sphaerobolus stellatus SS14]|uniref:Protein kinase domain-containing protein n=1 Tax=Sphaerobolus stellatus (strain SS14) TaxID=990650 RepID=A0A0C9V540_SPHS4|nr:hypothetical protein M422DRAFT_68132 [Sphaerobolus stellatus SS14]
MKANKECYRALVSSLIRLLQLIHDNADVNEVNINITLHQICRDFHASLESIYDAAKELWTQPKSKLFQYIKSDQYQKTLAEWQSQIDELRLNFILANTLHTSKILSVKRQEMSVIDGTSSDLNDPFASEKSRLSQFRQFLPGDMRLLESVTHTSCGITSSTIVRKCTNKANAEEYLAKLADLRQSHVVRVYRGNDTAERFFSDFNMLSQIQHPNVLQLFAVVSAIERPSLIFHNEALHDPDGFRSNLRPISRVLFDHTFASHIIVSVQLCTGSFGFQSIEYVQAGSEYLADFLPVELVSFGSQRRRVSSRPHVIKFKKAIVEKRVDERGTGIISLTMGISGNEDESIIKLKPSMPQIIPERYLRIIRDLATYRHSMEQIEEEMKPLLCAFYSMFAPEEQESHVVLGDVRNLVMPVGGIYSQPLRSQHSPFGELVARFHTLPFITTDWIQEEIGSQNIASDSKVKQEGWTRFTIPVSVEWKPCATFSCQILENTACQTPLHRCLLPQLHEVETFLGDNPVSKQFIDVLDNLQLFLKFTSIATRSAVYPNIRQVYLFVKDPSLDPETGLLKEPQTYWSLDPKGFGRMAINEMLTFGLTEAEITFSAVFSPHRWNVTQVQALQDFHRICGFNESQTAANFLELPVIHRINTNLVSRPD